MLSLLIVFVMWQGEMDAGPTTPDIFSYMDWHPLGWLLSEFLFAYLKNKSFSCLIILSDAFFSFWVVLIHVRSPPSSSIVQKFRCIVNGDQWSFPVAHSKKLPLDTFYLFSGEIQIVNFWNSVFFSFYHFACRWSSASIVTFLIILFYFFQSLQLLKAYLWQRMWTMYPFKNPYSLLIISYPSFLAWYYSMWVIWL